METTTEIEKSEKVGNKVIEVLNLEPIKIGKQKTYSTMWGEKTAIGLGRTILNIVDEVI